ncbi:MAG: transposase [Candidatus Aminicenantes bacterium]|nr:transposase [Candidatus Aminicenantes bacterium]NIM84885.1 transposase [Candidatus Aminicenantes bacterium]NIN24393.1 transposase [Candidatus Aminicenantes bacterium]NIN48157.1 transposase [Candidatus Aminicenantes bacterium]NIN91060.1 transposase [Candidatus Aminicenantes bacterium]
MAQGVLPFKYVESKKSQSMTNFSGLLAYVELLHRMGFFELVSRYVRVHGGDQGWLDSQILLHLLLLHLSGGDCPEDIERLESDKGLCKALKQLEKRLLGVKSAKEIDRRFRGRKGRQRCFASPNAIRNYMERFHNEKGEEDRVLGEAYIPVSNEYLEGLSWLNSEFLSFMQLNINSGQETETETETETLDGDATLVASEKSEALYCYKKFPGYQPLNIFWHEQGMVVHSEFRDGNVPAGHEIKRVFCESLDRLPQGVKKVRFRGDSAAYQYELLDFCELGDHKRFGRIEFVISCDICDSFKKSVVRIGDEEWKPIYRHLGNGIKIKTNQQWSEVAYVGSLKSPDYRYIVIREPIAHQRSLPLPGIGDGDGDEYQSESQRSLPFPNYEDPTNGVRYELSGLVTNMGWDGEELIHWSRKRCGNSEHAHSVMKSDLGGGKLPSGKFGANACWWQVMVLALNLHEMFKRLCLSPEWHNRRLKSLRYWFIYVVGRVEKWGRQLQVILDKSQKAFEMYINARKRIASLISLPGG